MKILVAVDDSPHSERAIQFVSRIRWPAGSRVIVATVMRPSALGPSADSANAETAALAKQRRYQGIILRAQGRLRAVGLSTEVRLIEGDAREQLVRLVESERMDVLVVGSRSHSGIVPLMLVGVSSHVVTHALCSVLVVRDRILAQPESRGVVTGLDVPLERPPTGC